MEIVDRKNAKIFYDHYIVTALYINILHKNSGKTSYLTLKMSVALSTKYFNIYRNWIVSLEIIQKVIASYYTLIEDILV